MSETYVTYRVWDGCKAPINLEYSGRLIGQIVRESTIDRDALLALADEMQGYADGAASGDGFPYVNAGALWSYADRIREALGVQDA